MQPNRHAVALERLAADFGAAAPNPGN